ncbi:hypothetical protein [Lentzea sp. NBRC 105346]|uniref:hypothetical protein n=1 Tax=Lentzea sp. NBRC 105346 TaxID=3032205 RepID=UPI0025570501|nr:hypothetical protein [Lentzea sp. NBRC 105346]
MKRYELTLDGEELPPSLRAAADQMMETMVAPFEPDGPEGAFSVLHSGEDAVWLNVYMWCQEAIVRCVMASAPQDDPESFEPLKEPLIGCVWELPILEFERSSWVRNMLLIEPSLGAYLRDRRPAGLVGGP